MAPTGLSNDEFLGKCFQHCTEKPTIDFVALAADVGMSSGGANNKYRAIMKSLEEKAAQKDGNTAPNAPTATNKPTPSKRKPATKKATKEATVDDDDADGNAASDDAEEPDRKKPKSTPKKSTAAATTTPKNTSRGRGRPKKDATTRAEEDATDAAPADTGDRTEILEAVVISTVDEEAA